VNGPWEARLDTHPTVSSYYWITPAGTGGDGWKDGEYLSVSGICSAEDANKIAAAPAMKDALDEVWAWLESTGHVMGLSELVEDALKQARGE
jgi:hypothetical protein